MVNGALTSSVAVLEVAIEIIVRREEEVRRCIMQSTKERTHPRILVKEKDFFRKSLGKTKRKKREEK